MVMLAVGQSATVPNKALWSGLALSALAVLFLLVDGVMKVMKAAPSVQGTIQLGYPESVVVGLGAILLVCTLLYVIPRTAVLGAILLTGYLGGAVASQVRVGAPLFSAVLFPVYFGVIVWGGFVLRDRRLRTLLFSGN
jgi:DoxX-like family